MHRSFSLRIRLTLWYSATLAMTLILFGVLAYLSVSRELHSNLDTSLFQVAESIHVLLKTKLGENGALPNPNGELGEQSRTAPKGGETSAGASDDSLLIHMKGKSLSFDTSHFDVESDPSKGQENPLWSSVYEHVLLNSKNFYIQIADSSGMVIWRSAVLGQETLPVQAPTRVVPGIPNAGFARADIADKDLRIAVVRRAEIVVSVGYSDSEIESNLNKLFSSFAIALPIVLFLSTIGGWFLAKYTLLPVDNIIEAARDITAKNLDKRLPVPATNDEIARLSETLNEMMERLKKSFDQTKQFSYDASHELKTPLAILSGELEMALHNSETVEDYEDALISALEEVSRMTNIVNGLLEIARAESGQMVLHTKQMNLSRLVSELAEDVEILADERQTTLAVDLEPNIYIDGDMTRLSQALLNLMENAVKYTADGGKIRVSLRKNDKMAEVEVRDNGIGISDEDMPKIFDRFYRVDKARSQEVVGNGLGLALTKMIIDAHKGNISVQSTLGVGSTFSIQLPVVVPTNSDNTE